MTKNRDFSIRLLKDNFTIENLDNVFKNNVNKKIVIDQQFEKGYKIEENKNLVWRSKYFNIENLYNINNSFLYFISIKQRIFVFSFGYGYTKIKDECFEERFGFNVALNALDSNKIKSMDLYNPSNNTKQKRIVSSILTNIYNCDYNDDNDFIENISGIVKDKYKDIFKNPTGKDSLKISTNFSREELAKLCDMLLELFSSEEYKKDDLFKNINKIKKATKSETIELNNQLDKELAIKENDKIFISDKDIIEPANFFCYKIANSKTELNNITLQDVRKSLKEISVEKLKNNYIKVLRKSDDNYPKTWKIFDCIVYDLEYKQKHFYLSKGIWYQIEDEFIKVVENNFLSHLENKINFIDFVDEYNNELRIGNEYYKEGEGHYNYEVFKNDNNLKLFDKKTIKLKNRSTLEICDLYDVKNNIFYHIKKGNKNASLSHLWNQGLNSEEICRLGENKEYSESFSEYGGVPNNRKIYYGIISKNKNISIFAKISFYNIINNFKLFGMDKNVKIFFINDKS